MSSSGGMFSDDGFRTRFDTRVASERIGGVRPRFALVEPVLPPELGAVVYAIRRAGGTVPGTWRDAAVVQR